MLLLPLLLPLLQQQRPHNAVLLLTPSRVSIFSWLSLAGCVRQCAFLKYVSTLGKYAGLPLPPPYRFQQGTGLRTACACCCRTKDCM
jgi:hypothetical protein